jgi:hypothetical protein
MKRNFSTLFSVIMMALLVTSTVYAGGAVKLSGKISIGSLHFDGTATGLGGYSQGVTITLTGIGQPRVQCINTEGEEQDGQYQGNTKILGSQTITSATIIVDKGKVPVGIDITDAQIEAAIASQIDPACQQVRQHDGDNDDDDWTAVLKDVIWSQANIDVYNGADTSGLLLRHQVYTCTTVDPTADTLNTSCSLTSDTSYH